MFVTMDERYMRDVKPLEGCLDAVKQMQPVAFSSAGVGGSSRMVGVAHGSLSGCASVAGHRDITGIGSVELERLVPVLVKAVQELAAEVEALKAAKRRVTRKPEEA